jgi:hypothetical protein
MLRYHAEIRKRPSRNKLVNRTAVVSDREATTPALAVVDLYTLVSQTSATVLCRPSVRGRNGRPAPRAAVRTEDSLGQRALRIYKIIIWYGEV